MFLCHFVSLALYHTQLLNRSLLWVFGVWFGLQKKTIFVQHKNVLCISRIGIERCGTKVETKQNGFSRA